MALSLSSSAMTEGSSRSGTLPAALSKLSATSTMLLTKPEMANCLASLVALAVRSRRFSMSARVLTSFSFRSAAVFFSLVKSCMDLDKASFSWSASRASSSSSSSASTCSWLLSAELADAWPFSSFAFSSEDESLL